MSIAYAIIGILCFTRRPSRTYKIIIIICASDSEKSFRPFAVGRSSDTKRYYIFYCFPKNCTNRRIAFLIRLIKVFYYLFLRYPVDAVACVAAGKTITAFTQYYMRYCFSARRRRRRRRRK